MTTPEMERLINITAQNVGHPIRKPEDMPFRVSTIPINNDWKLRIKSNWWATNYTGPQDNKTQSMLKLQKILLPFGGEETCFPYGDEDLNKIIFRGQLWYGDKVKMKKGQPCRCHENASDLWLKNKENTTIATGYALSKDGMWRQHSWVIDLRPRSTRIIETTERRLLYFGFALTKDECEIFTEANN